VKEAKWLNICSRHILERNQLLKNRTRSLKDIPSPLNTGARTSTLGMRLAGAVLGVPFFAAALVGIGMGRIPNRGHSPATDAFFQIAILYLLLVVLPCSAVLSAALSAFVAPTGQERRFAAGAFFYYAQMLLMFAVFILALFAYAGIGPFWARTLGATTFSASLLTFMASLVASGIGSAVGCVLGTKARLSDGFTTRLLRKLGNKA